MLCAYAAQRRITAHSRNLRETLLIEYLDFAQILRIRSAAAQYLCKPLPLCIFSTKRYGICYFITKLSSFIRAGEKKSGSDDPYQHFQLHIARRQNVFGLSAVAAEAYGFTLVYLCVPPSSHRIWRTAYQIFSNFARSCFLT